MSFIMQLTIKRRRKKLQLTCIVGLAMEVYFISFEKALKFLTSRMKSKENLLIEIIQYD